MYSWLVTVLLLARAAISSGGAQVPITSYTCTQPNIAVFLDHGQCTDSNGLRMCAIKEGARPALLSSSVNLGLYAWKVKTNPFVVLDIPQGWCVGSVRMTFRDPGGIPTLNLSVHSAERLSTNTDRTVFSIVSEDGTTPVVMNLTTLAHGKYLRINMTSTKRLYLGEIEVFGTNDSICTHPSSAGGDPAIPTTSVTPASPTTSVTPASPTTSVTPASPTTSATPIRAQVPITNYTCTQPSYKTFTDDDQCTVSRGLRTCAIKEGARPDLLSSSRILGVYGWDSNTNPFAVLDIPQGWCVESVKMTFRAPGGILTLSLSVHSAERLSTNTDRTMFSLFSEEGTTPVVMNLTRFARGKYLRINMTSTGRLYLGEIEVFGTNDSICTHPSSAGGDPASPTTSVTPASPTTSVTPASPTTSVSSSTNSVRPISTSDYCTTSGPNSTPSQSSTVHSGASFTTFTPSSLPSARPTTTSAHSSSSTTTPMSSQPRTSANATTSGPTSTPSQSSTIHSGTSFTTFTLSASSTPALSARPTTTSVHSSSFTTTPMSSQTRTIANTTTSGPTSTPSTSPSPTPGGVSVAPDSYVLPAAISAAAVLLLIVLTAIFVVVICIITRRHKTRKSLDTQRLSSIVYQSTLSDVTFKDNQFHTDKNGEVPIHSANGGVDKDHSGDIRETPCNYADLGPSESNDSVFQGAISRPTSQASIRSNEVTSKPAHEMVTLVHPSILNFENCNWETTMAGTDESGHYETSPRWQHAGGLHYNLSDCQLPAEGAARDDRRRVVKAAKAQVATTYQPPPQAPPTALPIVESAYADTLAEVPDKKREPSPISPTYASVDPPSSFPMPAATHQFKHSSHLKPPPSAQSPHVPQEDHIYSEVDKYRKKSASSTSSLPPRLTHRAECTHDYTTHQPPPQAPPSALAIVADIAYADTPVASEKKREPSTSSPTYANVDNQLHTGQSADVPIHDEKAAVDTNHNIDIRDAPHNYAVLGPSESTGAAHVGQGAAEEPVAEGAISRPTSQASIRSNEVSSKPTLGMVTRVHPSMLDHSYDSCNWETTMAGTDESGHYETSLHWQHAGGPYYNLSDCQVPGEDDRCRVLKDAKAQVGTTHNPPSQDPPSALSTAAGSAYANTPVASDKRKEPSTSGPTYANIDQPSSSSTLAAAQPSKHGSRPKPFPSAESSRVPQEDHIDKTSASSTSSPPAHLTHRADYTEVDADFWGGSGNVEGDTMAQPLSITSSTTAKGTVPTQDDSNCHIYAAVDYSKKKSRRVKES